MIFSKLYKENFKKLIAILLLGIFLWSNYGINFIHHHHDENRNIEVARGKSEPHECLVCNFQSLAYEPLVQKEFGIKEIFIETKEINYADFVSFVILERFYTIQQRGPPAFLG